MTDTIPQDVPIILCPPGTARGAYPDQDRPYKVKNPDCIAAPFTTRREHLLEDDDNIFTR